jgi:hypothetical protein
MSPRALEQRLASLESEVAALRAELLASKRPAKDWRRTIGAFTDDEGMKEIMKMAMQLREEDRKRTRPKKAAKRNRGR